MSDSNNELLRSKKRQKKRQDRVLNILIATVVISIIVVATFILKKPAENSNEISSDQQTENQQSEESEKDQSDKEEDDSSDDTSSKEDSEEDESEDEESEKEVQEEDSEDPVVDKSITDPNWKPIGTKQEGEHTSLYDGSSVDWQEKIDAISYATAINNDQLTVHWLKNGGAPNKAIGIASTIDESEMYRVYLEWVDGEGWKPTQVDVLNTLNFNYK